MIVRPAFTDYSPALILAQSIADIVKNPKSIQEAAEIHAKALQMTEDKKHEAEAATLAIEENKRIQAQLLQDKLDHKTYLETTQHDLDKQQLELGNDKESLNRAKSAFQEDVARVSAHLSNSVKEADDRHNQLDIRTADIIQREQTCHEIMSDINKREKVLDAREDKLKDDLQKLAAKKKKLAEATKDD